MIPARRPARTKFVRAGSSSALDKPRQLGYTSFVSTKTAPRTSLPRTPESYTSTLYCGPTSLRAFGVNSPDGLMSAAVAIGHLLREGWSYEYIAPAPDLDTTPTLELFIANHPTGDYLLRSKRHLMALRDGQLTDTQTDAGGRRLVRAAFRIFRKEV